MMSMHFLNRNFLLFATLQGIIYTSNLKADEYNHTGEIHQTINETAFLVPDALIEKPEQFKNERVVLIKTIEKETYFVTNNGLWKIQTNKLVKNLARRFE